MADVGGSFALISLFFQALIYPIAQHSFLVQFLNRLYLAKTLKDGIFLKNEEKDKKDKILDF